MQLVHFGKDFWDCQFFPVPPVSSEETHITSEKFHKYTTNLKIGKKQICTTSSLPAHKYFY